MAISPSTLSEPRPFPCPFCGYVGKLTQAESGDCPTLAYRVQCLGPERHCLDRWDTSPAEALAAWNARTPPPTCPCGKLIPDPVFTVCPECYERIHMETPYHQLVGGFPHDPGR